MAKRKDQLLWLQVINRAARSVGDKGTESFRMKDANEIHPTILCRRSANLKGNISTGRLRNSPQTEQVLRQLKYAQKLTSNQIGWFILIVFPVAAPQADIYMAKMC